MKVSSPVGDFPFTPGSLRFEAGELVVDGAMGAWPAVIRVGAQDVPVILRLVPKPLLAGGALLLGLLLLRRIAGR